MPDQDRKCKMISLRLSAEEYEALHTLYSNYGARSVSELARLAMQRMIGHPLPSENASFSKIQELDKRLAALEEKFELLLAREEELA